MYKPTHFIILNRKLSTGAIRSASVGLKQSGKRLNSGTSVKEFGKFFIRNKELPICSNCVHYIERENDYPYDGYRCKKFGEMDVITGVIKYDLAAVCRLGDSNCGKKGLHYTAKNQS